MNNELLYQLALTQVPNIGSIHAKILLQAYGNAKSIFQAPRHHLERIEGIGTVRADAIRSFNAWDSCDKEINFAQKKKIKVLFQDDEDYPKRLLHCPDSPILIFYKGNVSLNASRIVSVVGTRNHSEYGRHACEEFIEKIKDEQVLIISGLAFGIDTISHKAALKNELPTVGVLAHGLDRIYPPENRNLAKQMLENGGLVTEFWSENDPDRENFPMRNRIVAGMCDVVVVIESGKKGGSMITADIANSYNKDVFALPGRTSDPKSEGCNLLIRNNKAMLLTDAIHFLEMMNWRQTKVPKKKQRELFITLTENEQLIVDILKDRPSIHIDELYLRCNLSGTQTAAALLMLELNGIIISLPGKIYQLNL